MTDGATLSVDASAVLERFSAPTRAWFASNFEAPTSAQAGAWSAIADGAHTLVSAPTGSGKTLAAFLWAIDQIGTRSVGDGSTEPPGISVVYISPLRALASDIQRNLRAPLVGIDHAARRLGAPFTPATVATRTGDTEARERRRLATHPPDILVTTPESLYLLLTSAARRVLTSVQTVIVDEIHALVPTKRGAHLSISLERLAELTEREPQRIGLSATQRPLQEVAAFLTGGPCRRRSEIVEVPADKRMDLSVIVGDDEPERKGEWPALAPSILDEVRTHRSTLIFVDARRRAERLANEINQANADELLAASQAADGESGGADSAEVEVVQPTDLVKTHHGSVSKDRRHHIEEELKQGRLAGLVTTSSLELGIDVGACDLVVQVGSPGSVSSGLQRIGRSGHTVGATSVGHFYPRHDYDLLETAAVVAAMEARDIERTSYVRNPLDVLAQQIVACVAMDDWGTDDLFRLVTRSANFDGLSRALFDNTVDMLVGRYPSADFAEFRARLNLDRSAGVLSARRGSQRLAVTNPGTIPDRGLFGVFLVDGTRVGELDEEMVYEARPGEAFHLGASTWEIVEITFDRVLVTPAPGRIAKMPFWRGERVGRGPELGARVGALTREIADATASGPRGVEGCVDRLTADSKLSESSARRLIEFVSSQQAATGAVPSDRTVVVERFRDEIGDWRICVLTPFGNRVHAPWGTILRQRLSEIDGSSPHGAEVLWSDAGIVVRVPEAVEMVDIEQLLFDPGEVRPALVAAVGHTSLFASRFRECAARALLLPKSRPSQRTPLWQQRQRSADLLSAAAKYPEFPVLLETTRECLEDYFDVDALERLMRDIQTRRIRMVTVNTDQASPFARSLLFDWIAVFMYSGDAPLAERRASALSLDRALLADLLHTDELRSLLDAEVLADIEQERQRLSPRTQARNGEEVTDMARALGPMRVVEAERRFVGTPAAFVAAVEMELAEGRLISWGSAERWVAAAEDAGAVRDALGVALPTGLPAAFTEPLDDPWASLLTRLAATSAPFTAEHAATRFGVDAEVVVAHLGSLVASGVVIRGEFTAGRQVEEWCSPDVLAEARRRTLATLRAEIEPVEVDAYQRFVLDIHGVTTPRRGSAALDAAIEMLEGAPLVASAIESSLLAARVAGYEPTLLDALFETGELVWVGASPLGPKDGRLRLMFADNVDMAERWHSPEVAVRPECAELLEVLQDGSGMRWDGIVEGVGDRRDTQLDRADREGLLDALWDLAWAGYVTNDGFGAVRGLLAHGTGGRASTANRTSGRSRRRTQRRPAPAAGSGRWWALPAPRTASEGNRPSEAEPSPDRLRFIIETLLDRYGALGRDAALAESVPGGFAGLYPHLRREEERGSLRRGYFVAHLGAAQFARDGTTERLRAMRQDDEVSGVSVVLDASDPANLWGGVLAWPEVEGAWRPTRAAGRSLVLSDGVPVLMAERGMRRIGVFVPVTNGDLTAADAVAQTHRRALNALIDRSRARGVSRIEVQRVNDDAPGTSSLADALREAGFVDSYRGMSLSLSPMQGPR